MELSVQQYSDAISANALIPRQLKALQVLYSLPNSSATAKHLAGLIHPSKSTAIIASGRIGKIGKAFSKHSGQIPDTYFDNGKERLAYFTIVSEIYDRQIGWTMQPNLKKALEKLKLVNREADISERLTTEIQPYEENKLFLEGKVVQVFVNKYERSQQAKIECIKHLGDSCVVCGFNFGQVYGEEIAGGYIEVHHLNQLSDIKKEYQVNAITDLIPLCSNCHSVVHMTNPPMKPDALKKLLKKSSS